MKISNAIMSSLIRLEKNTSFDDIFIEFLRISEMCNYDIFKKVLPGHCATNPQSIVLFVDKWPLFVPVRCLLESFNGKKTSLFVCATFSWDKRTRYTHIHTRNTMRFLQFKRGFPLQD